MFAYVPSQHVKAQTTQPATAGASKPDELIYAQDATRRQTQEATKDAVSAPAAVPVSALQQKQRDIALLLGRIREESPQELVQKLLDIGLTDPQTCDSVAEQLLSNAMEEPKSAELVAQVCCMLHAKLAASAISGALNTSANANTQLAKPDIKRAKLSKCQDAFESAFATTHPGPNEEQWTAAKVARRHALGLAALMGHLYRYRCLSDNTIHTCLQTYLLDDQHPMILDLECLCEVLSIVGAHMENPEPKPQSRQDPRELKAVAAHQMTAYMLRIGCIVKNARLDKRTHSMLLRTVKGREKGWPSCPARPGTAL